jgi:hypothetical protein
MSKQVKPASNKSPLLNSRLSKQGSHVLSVPESFRAIEPQSVEFPPLQRFEPEPRHADLDPGAPQLKKAPDCPQYESMRDMQLLSEEIDKEMMAGLKVEL